MDTIIWITTHVSKGPLFENLVISELLKTRFNTGAADNLYYWRDKTGHEVDVLIDDAGQLTAIELKAGATIASDFFKGLNYLSLLSPLVVKKQLVYGGNQSQTRTDGTFVLPWNQVGQTT